MPWRAWGLLVLVDPPHSKPPRLGQAELRWPQSLRERASWTFLYGLPGQDSIGVHLVQGMSLTDCVWRGDPPGREWVSTLSVYDGVRRVELVALGEEGGEDESTARL